MGRRTYPRLHLRCSASLPYLVHKAAQVSGDENLARYVRRVVCEAVAKDLGLPVEPLLAEQPTRSLSAWQSEDVR